ncbi:efflux transporter outer membrane subunit [Parathalassolituus penaei]|uniref:TolC family protein n=1 Tax=Parathalassolituus penaei TaxID=2997323 RepID=A0A9X3EGB9_9GAMM|nr:TolC family protein [Parathalassolituus penaei]MCY0966214.1 TolC family protein [Parathalassolituus penaei]
MNSSSVIPPRLQRRSLASLLCLLLAGCATQSELPDLPQLRDSQWPQAHPQASIQSNSDISVLQPDTLAWWQRPDPQHLAPLIKATLAYNADISTARISYQQARLTADSSNASRWPQVSAQASAGRSSTPFADNGSAANSLGLGLSASWELDLWGELDAAERAAVAQWQGAGATLQYQQLSLLADLISAWSSLINSVERWRLAVDNRDISKATWQQMVWQRQAGLITDLDVANARTSWLQAEAAIPQWRDQYQQALQDIRIICGDCEAAARLPGQPDQLPVPDANLFDQQLGSVLPTSLQVPASQLQQRPDVQAAEWNLRASVASLDSSKASRWPSISLSGSLSSSSSNAASLFDPEQIVAQIAASIGYTLFDGGQIRNRISSAELDVQQALVNYRSALMSARQEVENALSALDSQQQQLQALLQAEDSAAQAWQLAQQQQQAGLLSGSDALTVQASWLSARATRVAGNADLRSSLITLYRALALDVDNLAPSATSSAATTRQE